MRPFLYRPSQKLLFSDTPPHNPSVALSWFAGRKARLYLPAFARCSSLKSLSPPKSSPSFTQARSSLPSTRPSDSPRPLSRSERIFSPVPLCVPNLPYLFIVNDDPPSKRAVPELIRPSSKIVPAPPCPDISVCSFRDWLP